MKTFLTPLLLLFLAILPPRILCRLVERRMHYQRAERRIDAVVRRVTGTHPLKG